MPLSAPLIFLFALLFNIAAKFILRYIGRLRSGVDALLFCSILTGYLYGAREGILYGALIAIAFFAINWRWISYAPYVIPLNAAAGALAAFLSSMPLISATIFVLIFYHVISFVITFFAYRSIGFGYFLFAVLNFITTYVMIGVLNGF